ncbi:hypothetical protein QYE76_067974 [Lolium multiflorum]|uniref:Exostosin GT47 domain-containing protein n=1 Tax=Lolium multiflorum TaxID=4521 RepID=A0AAD8SEC9_LOLMU|nr:hypothetical protein QYE76_067974 [Lolium multiflorum]
MAGGGVAVRRAWRTVVAAHLGGHARWTAHACGGRRRWAETRRVASFRFGRPDQCAGRYVYMYDLPPRFNADLARDCRRLSASTDMCKHVANDGFGPPIMGGGDGGSLPERGAYDTDQFMMGMIFHARMRQHECLTADPTVATAVYVPFYAGFDAAMNQDNSDLTVRGPRHGGDGGTRHCHDALGSDTWLVMMGAQGYCWLLSPRPRRFALQGWVIKRQATSAAMYRAVVSTLLEEDGTGGRGPDWLRSWCLQVVVESMERDETQENFMVDLIANGTLDDRDDVVIPDDGGDDVTTTFLNDSGEGAENIEEEDPNGAGEEEDHHNGSGTVVITEPSGSSTSSIKSRKRGPAKKLDDGVRHDITHIAKDGKPIAPEKGAKAFIAQCGVLVRDHVPITVREWNKPKGLELSAEEEAQGLYIDDVAKNSILTKLMSHFNIVPEEGGAAEKAKMEHAVTEFR